MAHIDIGEIYRRAFEVTRKHKWLWVYGLVLAALSGSSSISSSSNIQNSIKDYFKKTPEDLPDKTSYVLGQTTGIIKEWLTNTPFTTLILLILSVISIVLFWSILSLIIKSWAKGGLIAGIDDALDGKPTTLVSTSLRGTASVKRLIIFWVISSLIGFFSFLTIFSIVIVGYLMLNFSVPLKIAWLILSGLSAVLTIILLVMLFTMIEMYAERLIILKNFSPWTAWKQAFHLSRKHFFPTLLLGVLNMLFGCMVSCVSLLIASLIVGLPAFIFLLPITIGKPSLAVVPFIFVVMLFILVFGYLVYAIGALIVVFKHSTWNVFVRQIEAEDKK